MDTELIGHIGSAAGALALLIQAREAWRNRTPDIHISLHVSVPISWPGYSDSAATLVKFSNKSNTSANIYWETLEICCLHKGAWKQVNWGVVERDTIIDIAELPTSLVELTGLKHHPAFSIHDQQPISFSKPYIRHFILCAKTKHFFQNCQAIMMQFKDDKGRHYRVEHSMAYRKHEFDKLKSP